MRRRLIILLCCLPLLCLCARLFGADWLYVGLSLAPIALFMAPLFSASVAGNLYWSEGSTSATLTVNYPTSLTDLTTGTSTTFTSGTTDCMCYDRKNDLIWQASGTSVVARSNNPASSTTTYSFTAPQNVVAIDCDPTNTRVFYITKNGGSFDLRKINYDGTGGASLITWSGGFTNAEIDVRYDLTDDHVYYVKALTSASSTTELRYISPSGTGDTLVASKSDPFGGYGRIHSIAIDVTNRYLFWVESTNTFSANLQRSTMSGGSVTTIASSLGSGTYKITFSQLQSKVYVWMGNGGLGSGDVVRYMNTDGTSNTSLGIPVGSTTGTKSAWFALGTGFETIGVSAIL